MTRRLFFTLAMISGLSATQGWGQASPAASAGGKPVITVVTPSIQSFYDDLEFLVKDLAKGPQEFDALKSTIDVFLEGVDATKPTGVQTYLTAEGLRFVITLPVDNDKEFKKFMTNLWDLDVKSYPPPTPQLLSLVPPMKRQAGQAAKMAANERMLFNLADGFLRYDAAAKLVYIGQTLPDVRVPKGAIDISFLKGYDLAVHIDGAAQTTEDRKKAIESRSKKFLEQLTQGEKETKSEFELRKSIVEIQLMEIERFFAESSKILVGWTTSAKEKNGTLEIDLTGMKDSSLAKSIDQLGQAPDEFSGATKEGTAVAGNIDFPIDPERKAYAKTYIALTRNWVKETVDAAEYSAEKKQLEKDIGEIALGIVDAVADSGNFNGFVRTWANGNGRLTTVAGCQLPDGAKIVDILSKVSDRLGKERVSMKVDAEGDVEIHKVLTKNLLKNYPELFDAEGAIFVGTSATSTWVAVGDKALDKLKQVIKDVKAAGAKPASPFELALKVGPLVETFDKIRSRQPAAAPAPKPAAAAAPAPAKAAPGKKDDKKAAGSKTETTRPRSASEAKSLLTDIKARELAVKTLKEGKDTVTVTLVKNGQTAEVRVKIEEGILLFFGRTTAAIVKELGL